MAKLNILHFPDERLRKKALPIEAVDNTIQQLGQDMLETMYAEGGVGLAATQVNVQKRLIVIDISADRKSPIILINPTILSKDGNESAREGCLSVPDYFDVVERAKTIKYSYLTLANEMLEAVTDGLLAICIQHEIDHLDGKLFIDYLSPLKYQRLKKKINKQERIQQLVL